MYNKTKSLVRRTYVQSTSVCYTYKMNKIRELKIDSTLWATPSKIINLLDFKPEKLSIETKSNTNNDIKVHQVSYENGGFYLTIDNIRALYIRYIVIILVL